MRQSYRLDVTLTLLGPILTKGGGMIDPGIDAPIARDGLGRAMLPFSLIKGKVRDALSELGCPKLKDWFGDEAGSAHEPERGRLRFGDFVTETQGCTYDDVIERIEIDASTGTTAGRMLAMIEAPFGYGQPVPFRGVIEFIAEEAEATSIKAALDEALRWVPAYGALRTVGFGRTYRVETNQETNRSRSIGRPLPGASSLPLRLHFDRPICCVGRKHSGNHFESLRSVPGAVLKGAVARLILELDGSGDRSIDPHKPSPSCPNLSKHFEAIRFSEARPMKSDATCRPVEPPLSIVTSPTSPGEYFDVALKPGPILIDSASPAFEPDWKGSDHGLVREEFGWPDLPTERRTRTRIEESTGRAKDEALFSYGLVLPEVRRDDGRIESFVWETVIGLEHVDANDCAAVADELADLLAHGLPNIGKTRAVAEPEWLVASTPGKVPQVLATGTEHVVTLQTEFLMTDPGVLGDGQPEDLKKAYEEFWIDVSGGALKLVRYFARQSLHGGFLSKRSRQGSYQPFLVTERGSTFVLETIKANEAGKLLSAWQATGLPVPGWIKTRFGGGSEPLWKCCPFLPHVGFGEVAIDLECHTQKRPPGNRA